MAYSYVKTVANTANSNSVTFSPTNGGDLLIIECSTSGGGGNPTWTATDNLGSTYSLGVAASNNGANYWAGFRYLENCPAGITSITLTFNGGTPGECVIRVHEYSGIATSSSLIGTPIIAHQNAPGTGTDALTAGPLDVTSQPALVVGMVMSIATDPTISAGTGYTQRYSANGMFLEDLRATSTGNQTVVATAGTGTPRFSTIIAAFAEPADSGVTVTPSPAVLTLDGKTPSTNAFTKVIIREVLINESGQAVADGTGYGVSVWYSGVPSGAPDVSLSAQTTDSNGSTSWSVSTGSLVNGQTIFYVATNANGGTPTAWTCGRVTPSYE